MAFLDCSCPSVCALASYTLLLKSLFLLKLRPIVLISFGADVGEIRNRFGFMYFSVLDLSSLVQLSQPGEGGVESKQLCS